MSEEPKEEECLIEQIKDFKAFVDELEERLEKIEKITLQIRRRVNEFNTDTFLQGAGLKEWGGEK